MNEEKDHKPQGSEHDFSEFAKHSRPQSGEMGGRSSRGGSFLRGCYMAFGIVVGVVAVVFFLILGVCFIGPMR